jgi:hypothetical protein
MPAELHGTDNLLERNPGHPLVDHSLKRCRVGRLSQ